MKPAHLLVHLVRAMPDRRAAVHSLFDEHVRTTLSKEEVTGAIKRKLLAHRMRESMKEELRALEHELLALRGAQDNRAQALAQRIASARKKIENI